MIGCLSEEKKVRRYLDDNFTNRPELTSPVPPAAAAGHADDREAEFGSLKKQQYKGTGPKTRDGEGFCRTERVSPILDPCSVPTI